MHMYEVAIRHLEWIDIDEEVLQIRPMIARIGPMVGASYRCFYCRPTWGYPKVGDYLVRDCQIWNLKVNVRTQDTNLDWFGPLE
jgi:hypothetical protein